MTAGFILGRAGGDGCEPHRIGFGPALPVTRKRKGALIRYAGDAPLLTVAPTGAGKSVGPVMCNALDHPGSLIVLDVKGECYQVSAARRRAMGQDVQVLDLRDGGMPGSLNPLDLVRRSGQESASVARSFAATLIERSASERDRFWTDWAETIITGGVAWLLDDCEAKDRNLGHLFDLLTHDDAVYNIATKLDKGGFTSRAARTAFVGLLSLSERETRPSVMGTVQTHLRLFDSDLVRRLTDTTSIDIDGLIAGKPISLYVIVPPVRLDAYRPLLRTWFSGLLYAMTERTSLPEHRTLFLCDEAASLGRMDALLMASSLMRSWGVTLWTIWQTASQLSIYGSEANTLVDNAGVIQFFGARNRRMAAEISALVGGIEPDEILDLGRDEQVLLIDGGKPQKAKQARYYEDALFRGLYESNPMISVRQGR